MEKLLHGLSNSLHVLSAVTWIGSMIYSYFGGAPALKVLDPRQSHAIGMVANRRFVFGAPILLMAGGKVIRQNMRKALLPTELLLSEMRNVDAPNPAEVEYAMMETSGHVSVVKKAAAQPVTAWDLNIPAVEPGLPALLVDDGRIQ